MSSKNILIPPTNSRVCSPRRNIFSQTGARICKPEEQKTGDNRERLRTRLIGLFHDQSHFEGPHRTGTFPFATLIETNDMGAAEVRSEFKGTHACRTNCCSFLEL